MDLRFYLPDLLEDGRLQSRFKLKKKKESEERKRLKAMKRWRSEM